MSPPSVKDTTFTFYILREFVRTSRFSFFVWKDRIKSREIYAWIQIVYQHPKYPGLPMYYHEYAILTSVKEYATWTEEHDTNTRRALNQQLPEKLKRQEKRGDQPDE